MNSAPNWIKNGLTWVALIIVTLNVEAVATALKLDKLALNPGLWGRIAVVIEHPATLTAATFVIGVFVGTWLERAMVFSRTPKADPKAPLIELGHRMRDCAQDLGHIHEYGGLGVSDHQKREVVAQVNGLMVDAQRMGLATPPPSGDAEPVIAYFTEVGNWLSRGDLDIAKQQAAVRAKTAS